VRQIQAFIASGVGADLVLASPKVEVKSQ
jgi:hypothetical protein